MSILKVIEILTSSEKGWEDAAQKAVTLFKNGEKYSLCLCK
jgi:flavin-binding protein dodecin